MSEIDDGVANTVVAKLLFLDSEDSAKPITLYLNSPGGSVTAALAIADTIGFVKTDVSTCCIGTCSGMAALLLALGARGQRSAIPTATMGFVPFSGTSRRRAGPSSIGFRRRSSSDWRRPRARPRSHRRGLSVTSDAQRPRGPAVRADRRAAGEDTVARGTPENRGSGATLRRAGQAARSSGVDRAGGPT